MAIDAALGRLGIKPGVCTSSTRPANPFEGQVVYETDTNRTLVYDNAAWVVIANASSTGFPTSLDTNTVDSIAALQAKVGVDSSAVATSLDYKVAQLEAISHGKILQVVEGSTTTPVTIATTTLTSIGLSASITPTSADSKVLIVTMTQVNHSRSTSSMSRGYRLNRNGSALITYESSGASSNTFRQVFATGVTALGEITRDVYVYLDSPATTSSTTYDVDANVNNNTAGQTSEYQNDNNPSKIYLLEVSA